mmetsp:Transcript_38590/g.89093  ORF Transcript_38590/g.89093 Transcript_38590/m.89093 type:complete len:123 (+) Transcript_38590:404-772(+)
MFCRQGVLASWRTGTHTLHWAVCCNIALRRLWYHPHQEPRACTGPGHEQDVCIWFIGVPCNLAVIAVWAYNAEFKAIRREMKNGMVSPMAYVIANSLLQLPPPSVRTLLHELLEFRTLFAVE